MKDYNKEIEELEYKIKILKEEKKNFDLLMPNRKLAEMIHSKLCRSNHTDGCSWYYENWDGLGNKSVRNSYLEKANNILNEISYEQAITVLKFI